MHFVDTFFQAPFLAVFFKCHRVGPQDVVRPVIYFKKSPGSFHIFLLSPLNFRIMRLFVVMCNKPTGVCLCIIYKRFSCICDQSFCATAVCASLSAIHTEIYGLARRIMLVPQKPFGAAARSTFAARASREEQAVIPPARTGWKRAVSWKTKRQRPTGSRWWRQNRLPVRPE